MENTARDSKADVCATRLAAARVCDTRERLEDVRQIVLGNAWPSIEVAEEELFPFRTPTHSDLVARVNTAYAGIDQILYDMRHKDDSVPSGALDGLPYGRYAKQNASAAAC